MVGYSPERDTPEDHSVYDLYPVLPRSPIRYATVLALLTAGQDFEKGERELRCHELIPSAVGHDAS